jgi:hypothetical protein
MYRLIRTLAVAVVCVSGVVACSSDDDTATKTNDPSPTEPSTTAEPAGATDVVGATEAVETTEPVQVTELAPSTTEPAQLPPMVTLRIQSNWEAMTVSSEWTPKAGPIALCGL